MDKKEPEAIINENIERHKKLWMEISKVCNRIDNLPKSSKNKINDLLIESREKYGNSGIASIKKVACMALGINPPNEEICYACCVFDLIQKSSKKSGCEYLCPFRWGSFDGLCASRSSEYSQFKCYIANRNYSKASEIALKIANLPVREWDEENQCFK